MMLKNNIGKQGTLFYNVLLNGKICTMGLFSYVLNIYIYEYLPHLTYILKLYTTSIHAYIMKNIYLKLTTVSGW